MYRSWGTSGRPGRPRNRDCSSWLLGGGAARCTALRARIGPEEAARRGGWEGHCVPRLQGWDDAWLCTRGALAGGGLLVAGRVCNACHVEAARMCWKGGPG